MPPKPGAERHWQRLIRAAQEEVDAVLSAMPRPLAAKARQVPLSFEPKPTRAMIEDGVEDDLLGLFIGEAFPDSESGAQNLPAQVILFLDNLWDYADGDSAAYRDEVRRTYLHEIGHYLGLDELDLEDRGLD